MKKRNIGIYQIKNIVNNKSYVGSSKNIKKRWVNHISDLNNNKHTNQHLQNAWNKYGIENFTFSVLELLDTTDFMFEKEKSWIINLNTINNNFGYNKAFPNDAGYQILSNEALSKLRQFSINRAKNIITLELTTGKFLKRYESIGLCISDLKFTQKSTNKIYEVLSGKRKAYKGLIFIYEENYNPNKNYAITTRFRKNKSNKVLQYDLNMNLIKEWNSCKEVASELDLNISSLRTSCTKNTKYKNSFWKIKK